MKRVLLLCAAAAALSGAAAPTAFGDAGSGDQPQNAQACAAISQVAGHSPGAANGEAIGDLLVAFCLP